jgi:hypothetical protein
MKPHFLLLTCLLFLSSFTAHAQFGFSIVPVPSRGTRIEEASVDKSVKPVVGLLAYPFKYRPQSGKFEKAFTISAAGGVSIPLNEDGHTLLALASVGAFCYCPPCRCC